MGGDVHQSAQRPQAEGPGREGTVAEQNRITHGRTKAEKNLTRALNEKLPAASTRPP